MTPEPFFFQPGLLKIPNSMVPKHLRDRDAGKTTLGLVTEVTTDLLTGKQMVRTDLESPAQAAEKILREAEDGG